MGSSTGMTPRKMYLSTRHHKKEWAQEVASQCRRWKDCGVWYCLRRKGYRGSKCYCPGGVVVWGSKYTADRNHYRHYPRSRCPPCTYQQNYHNSENGEENEDQTAPKARPTVPGLCQATTDTLLLVETVSASVSHSIPSLLCGEKCWKVLTTKVQENKVDQWDRTRSTSIRVTAVQPFHTGPPRQS